jgi:hypothetical protein
VHSFVTNSTRILKKIGDMEFETPQKRSRMSTGQYVDMTPAKQTPETQVPYTDQAGQNVVVCSCDIDVTRSGVRRNLIHVSDTFSTSTMRAVKCNHLYIENVYGNLGSDDTSRETNGLIEFEYTDHLGVSGVHVADFATTHSNTMYRIQWNKNHHAFAADNILGLNLFHEIKTKFDALISHVLFTVSLNEPYDGRLRISFPVSGVRNLKILTPSVLFGTDGYTREQLLNQGAFGGVWLSPNVPLEGSIQLAHLTMSGLVDNTLTSRSSTTFNTLATVPLANRYAEFIHEGPFPTVQLETTRRHPSDIALQLVDKDGNPMPPTVRWVAHLTLFK